MREQTPGRRPRRSGIGTGTTSLLMIFTLLCLATLALLSLATARSDNRIKQRGVDMGVSLLAAEGEAAEGIALLDHILAGAAEVANSEEAFFELVYELLPTQGFVANAEYGLVGFATEVDDTTLLYTVVRPLPPSDGPRYELVSQSTESTYEWQPVIDGGVWQGN